MYIKTLLLLLFSFSTQIFGYSTTNNDDLSDVNEIESVQMSEIIVTATVFHPVASQTDDEPLVTASTKTIDVKKLNSGKLKWIAVSRDLFKKYEFAWGDVVEVISSTNPELNGEYHIEDLLNPYTRNQIDILVPTKYGANFMDDKCKLRFYGKCLM